MHLDAQTIFIAITAILLAYFLIIKCLPVIGVACNKAKRYRLAAACFSCLIFLRQQRVGDIEAKAALERAIALNLSRILLRPLFLLEHKSPAFFQQYAQPLLIGNTLNAVESI